MDWLKGLGQAIASGFSTVVNWVTGSGGGAVQAVAGEVVKGAVAGAIIGAASAAIQGEDIKKGALYGAAAGGVAGGVKGIWEQISTEATPAVSHEETKIPETQSAPVPETQGWSRPDNMQGPRTAIPDSAPAQIPPVTQEPPTASKGLLNMSDSTAKIVAGVGQGAATGLLANMAAKDAAKDAAKTQRDADERRWAREDEIKARGLGITPRVNPPQVPTIAVRSWWQKHLDPSTNLINTKGAA